MPRPRLLVGLLASCLVVAGVGGCTAVADSPPPVATVATVAATASIFQQTTINDLLQSFDTVLSVEPSRDYAGWLQASILVRAVLVKGFLELLEGYDGTATRVQSDLYRLLDFARAHRDDARGVLPPGRCVQGHTLYTFSVDDEYDALLLFFGAIDLGRPELVDRGEDLMRRSLVATDEARLQLPPQRSC